MPSASLIPTTWHLFTPYCYLEQQSLPSHGRICCWCFHLAVHIQQGEEKVVHSEREFVSGTASPIPTPSHYLYPYPITLSVSLPLHIICVPCEIVLSLQYVRSAQVEFDGCTVLLFYGLKFSYKSVIAFMWFVFLFPVEWHQLQSPLLWNSWSFAGCVLEMFGSFVYTYVHCVHALIELSWLAGLVQKQLSTCL